MAVDQFFQALASNPYLILVPVGALVVAVLSAALSVLSLMTSRQSLRISKLQEKRRHEKLSFDVLSVVRDTTGTSDVYKYEIEVRNPSDRSNSVAHADLKILYLVDGALATASARPAREPANGLTVLEDIPANQSRTADFQFVLPKGAISDYPIDHVTLVLTDTFGVECERRSEHVPAVTSNRPIQDA